MDSVCFYLTFVGLTAVYNLNYQKHTSKFTVSTNYKYSIITKVKWTVCSKYKTKRIRRSI